MPATRPVGYGGTRLRGPHGPVKPQPGTSRMKVRATLIVSSTIFALGACKDSGLPDRNLPLDQAEHRAPDALVQAVHPNAGVPAAAPAGEGHEPTMIARPITVGGQVFQASGMPARMSEGSLRA